MFDVGPSELFVIAVVALVVLGPTRLPGLVRKIGRWVGKARSMARDFREQLENEVNVDELNRAAKEHLSLDTPPPFEPPRDYEAAPTAADGATAAAGAAGMAATDPESPVSAGEAAAATVDLTYPYGTPTDTSIARSADPSVLPPEPGDDTYSHAHAYGEEPQPWSDHPPLPADAGLPDAAPMLEPEPPVKTDKP